MCDRHLVGAMLAVLLTSSATAFADVYRWDTGQLISGSEGIVLGPGTVVSSQNLEYADLRELDLTDSYFRESNLVYADFSNSDLQGADLRDAKLTHVNLTDTNVSGVRLDRSTTLGLTAEQLYSTASYKSRNLRGIGLGGNDLQGWNFAGQDLTDASISGANLTASSFDDAVIKGISLR
ncbi:MAG: pentapeptide repeat-containing protein, partial [Planctomycetales bacterium]|nr:pentapeptide repeat-containing protein [Planctomycetales bacterium]